MTERDYWAALEYRICRELEGTGDPSLRFMWCDGLIPDSSASSDSHVMIQGRAFMPNPGWRFRLFLPANSSSAGEQDWSKWLPPENETEWLKVDLEGKRIDIEPGKGVPD